MSERAVIGAGPYGYVAGFNGTQIEIWAHSQFRAYQEAIHYFKPSKRRSAEVWVALCERADGSQVVHVADF